MRITISDNGQLAIPLEFQGADGLRPGQECEFERIGLGMFRLKATPQTSEDHRSLLDVLRDCPEKGLFEAMERRETTDDLQTIDFE